MIAMKVNPVIAAKYELHASRYATHFLPLREQEAYGTASTDQGNVSHEIPAIQAIYHIETPDGADNHSIGFAEVDIIIV
jgi:hypothetical protein